VVKHWLFAVVKPETDHHRLHNWNKKAPPQKVGLLNASKGFGSIVVIAPAAAQEGGDIKIAAFIPAGLLGGLIFFLWEWI